MPERGVCYVIFGQAARREAGYSAEALRRRNDLPVVEISEAPGGLTDEQKARWCKVRLDELSPFDLTCYLDADTRPAADLSPGFGMLADGWELVAAHSENQDPPDLLWHVGEEEREATLDRLGNPRPLVLQCGVLWFRKCPAVRNLFRAWREEWEKRRGMDQAAFLRALHASPARLWVMGRGWNGGNLIRHRHGMAARKG